MKITYYAQGVYDYIKLINYLQDIHPAQGNIRKLEITFYITGDCETILKEISQGISCPGTFIF